MSQTSFFDCGTQAFHDIFIPNDWTFSLHTHFDHVKWEEPKERQELGHQRACNEQLSLIVCECIPELVLQTCIDREID